MEIIKLEMFTIRWKAAATQWRKLGWCEVGLGGVILSTPDTRWGLGTVSISRHYLLTAAISVSHQTLVSCPHHIMGCHLTPTPPDLQLGQPSVLSPSTKKWSLSLTEQKSVIELNIERAAESWIMFSLPRTNKTSRTTKTDKTNQQFDKEENRK